MRARRAARAFFLGRRRYGPIHALMNELHAARVDGAVPDTVLFVEHEPVVTLGRAAKAGNVLFTPAQLAARGVDLEETGRGGDVTFHGPGQLVAYPVLDLKPDRCDLRRYVRELAEVMILVARDHGVEAGTVDGMVGVWADAEQPDQWATAPWARRLAKIGAIGVRASRWVTMHGFALNLTLDPSRFEVIVPCGIRAHPVESLARLSGKERSVRDVALGVGPHFASAMDLDLGEVLDLSALPDPDLANTVQARGVLGRAESSAAPPRELSGDGEAPARQTEAGVRGLEP